MIEHQNRPVREVDEDERSDMRMGAEILRLTLAYEKLIHRGALRTDPAHRLASQNKGFIPEFFDALVTLDPNSENGEIRKCRIEVLSPGMIIQEELRLAEGALLVSKGQEVIAPPLIKPKNFHARHMFGGDVTVSTPTTTLTFVRGASKGPGTRASGNTPFLFHDVPSR